MNWLAIVNPKAGCNGSSDLQHLVEQLDRELGASCVYSARRNHTGEIVHEHPEFEGYIAVGGDGTLSEVLNGLPDDSHCVGLIPVGTSNGLAHDLHLTDLETAVRALRRPHFRRLDVISVRIRRRGAWFRRKMLSTSGLGYIAGATEVAYRYKPRLHLLAHFIGAVWQPFRQRAFPVRLRLDDEPWQELILTSLAVHNTQYLGNFRLFPEARVDDGQFDVLFGRLSAFDQLREDLAIFLRTYHFTRSVHRPARHLEIEIPQRGTLMVDGDLYHDVEAVQYDVEPGRLTFCTAPPASLESEAPRGASSITRSARQSKPTPASPGSVPKARRRRGWPGGPRSAPRKAKDPQETARPKPRPRQQ